MSTQSSNSYLNRDLSWLSFNHRVLQEAADNTLPLYDSIKFLAIFSSNLDEFFRVRVASIRRLNRIDKKKITKKLPLDPEDVLRKIHEQVLTQQEEFGDIFRNKIMPALKIKGVYLYQAESIDKKHLQEMKNYFWSHVMSYLQPIILHADARKKPFLENGALYFFLKLIDKETHEVYYAHLNIPSNHLPRFFALSKKNSKYFYVFLDDIIRHNLHLVFPGYEVVECCSVKMNRDADLNIEDEFSGDLVDKIKKQLTSRNIGSPARFLYDGQMSEDLIEFIAGKFQLEEDDLVAGGRYHNLNDLMSLPNPLGNSKSEDWPPISIKSFEKTESIFELIDRKDQMLHFPYHSYDYVLRFFNEAAIDPRVYEINATFYRVASDSLIVNALISAARNGKKVVVFVEVKARFDEANNLKWASRMEEAGIKIIYSFPGLKVHAKVALIKRNDPEDGKKHYAFLGTGNFNEKTARIYADHGLLTSHNDLTRELNQVFRHLHKGKKLKKVKSLLVSQYNMQEVFLKKIDREIKIAKNGGRAYLIIKINNLEDQVMIDKLYEASAAGVKIDCCVRGICCLVPEKEGLSENIRVTRIVDRFLEHARIFYFYNQGAEEIYMGSADWMKRNLYHRIEVVFPVLDQDIKADIKKLLDLQLSDNVKACYIDSQGNNLKKNDAEQKVSAQQDFYHWLQSRGI